jgi:hypothetical protein
LLYGDRYPEANGERGDYGGAQGKAEAGRSPGMMGIGDGAARIEVGADRHGGGRDDQAHAQYAGQLGQRPASRRGGQARQPR